MQKLNLKPKKFLREHITSLIDGDLIPLVHHLQLVHERTSEVLLFHAIMEILFKGIQMMNVINGQQNMFKSHAKICSTIIKRILGETCLIKLIILK